MNRKIDQIEKFARENLDELDWIHTKKVKTIAKKLADLKKMIKKLLILPHCLMMFPSKR